MRPGHFEALAPLCPRCLHERKVDSPLVMASVDEERAGHVIQAILHCSNTACWMEFPVIDGVPVIVRDPRGYMAQMAEQILARQDLAPALATLMGDSLGQGSGYETTRQHLSIYAGDHYRDWTAGGGDLPDVAATLRHGLKLAGAAVGGPALDLGCATGRGAWELAAQGAGPVLGADMSFAMLRLAQRLLIDGEGRLAVRRVGLVYDEVTLRLPEDVDPGRVDFWALDAAALPFRQGRFALGAMVNLVDSMAAPAQGISELARVLAPDARAVLATPYDWSTGATQVEGWLGGHSQRGDAAGQNGGSEPVLRAVIDGAGLDILAEANDLTWRLTLHARAVMEYRLHLLALRRRSASSA